MVTLMVFVTLMGRMFVILLRATLEPRELIMGCLEPSSHRGV